MEFQIANKLVHTSADGEKTVVGYGVSMGGNYTCSVTLDKAIELGVKDIKIAHLFDLDEVEVVPIGRTKYGVVANNSGFFEDFAETPCDYFGDRKLYYGYYFEDRFMVSLDSDTAINRMIAEAQGNYADE